MVLQTNKRRKIVVDQHTTDNGVTGVDVWILTRKLYFVAVECERENDQATVVTLTSNKIWNVTLNGAVTIHHGHNSDLAQLLAATDTKRELSMTAMVYQFKLTVWPVTTLSYLQCGLSGLSAVHHAVLD